MIDSDPRELNRWRRALDVAFCLLIDRGEPPVSAAELCACVHPPRETSVALPGAKTYTRREHWELRRELLARLVALGWSANELCATCRFDKRTVRAELARRELARHPNVQTFQIESPPSCR